MENNAASTKKVVFIAVTGPECTGKSTLARQLAEHYNTLYVPEYARDYVAQLGRPYTYEDVLHIAGIQLKQHQELSSGNYPIVFLDTYLIITKVWMDVVYNTFPAWIDEEIKRNTIDLYLLCNMEIPWEPDPVRENGGEMREYLFNVYRNELEIYGCNYAIISGKGEERLKQAVKAVNDLLHTFGQGQHFN